MAQIKNLNNLLSFNAWSQRYVRNDLLFPERELLILLRDNLKDMDVLDLGVGAGRTSFTFTALARTYIGIDYAPGMVATCRSRFGESDRHKFMCLDAADLLKFDDKKFDLVLFSFNGMDCVDLQRRHKILHEVHRLLKSDGYFFFSGLSLDALPWPMDWPRFRLTRPLHSMVALARKAIWNSRLVLANWGQDIDELKKRVGPIFKTGHTTLASSSFMRHVAIRYESFATMASRSSFVSDWTAANSTSQKLRQTAQFISCVGRHLRLLRPDTETRRLPFAQIVQITAVLLSSETGSGEMHGATHAPRS